MILSFLGFGNMPGLALFYALAGLILLLSGGLTLWHYLRHNPLSDEVVNES